jgi:hypothetical protein
MPGSRSSRVLKALSAPGGGRLTGCAAVVLVAGLLMASAPAQATHAASHASSHGVPQAVGTSAQKGGTAVATKDVEAVGSIQTDEERPNCNRSRKKLWVEDEGWIVRQVTTCY